MKLLFILEEGLDLNIPSPTRVLNLQIILNNYISTSIICKKNFSPLEIKKGIITVPGYKKGFIRRQFSKLRISKKALGYIMTNRPNYIVTRNYYYVFLLKFFAKIFGAKIIYDMHGFGSEELIAKSKKNKAFFIEHLENIAHRFSDKIIVINQEMFKDLKHSLKERTIILPNGVNLEEIQTIDADKKLYSKYNLKKDKKIVGFLGNIIDWVDINTLLESSKYLDKNFQLLIVGNYSEVKNISELKEKYPNTTFTNRVDHREALQLLKLMDVVTLPYKKDEVLRHLSLRKTTEYLAMGKPIVMSNSNLMEKNFLKENQNMILYEMGNPKDLANKIKFLLSNKSLLKNISLNNLKLAKNFTWENQITNSKLFDTLGIYDYLKNEKVPIGTITIIIKALNEEKYIQKCVESALAALKGLKGDVILVDSKSNDRTVELAKKYPIRILQLNDEKERRCGIGPQIGFLYSKGDFIYILDGDMVLDKNFLRKALPYFNNKNIAGIGGNIFEKSKENLLFQIRAKYNQVKETTEVNQLGMGGLYKREAIENVRYFSNPYFFAYEEYDLGRRLGDIGYKMIRIPEKMIEHYGDETTSLKTLTNKWKSKYLFGSGQYLKTSIKDHCFSKTFNELKIYILTLLWVIFGLISLISLLWTYSMLIAYIIATFIIWSLLLIRKKSFNKLIFSFFSWNLQALGMVIGILFKDKSPTQFKPNVKIIK